LEVIILTYHLKRLHLKQYMEGRTMNLALSTIVGTVCVVVPEGTMVDEGLSIFSAPGRAIPGFMKLFLGMRSPAISSEVVSLLEVTGDKTPRQVDLAGFARIHAVSIFHFLAVLKAYANPSPSDASKAIDVYALVRDKGNNQVLVHAFWGHNFGAWVAGTDTRDPALLLPGTWIVV